jgi:NADH:ubiquinone oxidoreductase subunit F (NADH-binding)
MRQGDNPIVLISRILDPEPVASLDAYVANGGGRGLHAARALEPAAVIAQLRAAGVRGRGGAGFPTAIKWRTVAANASPTEPTTVVVNAAEGEPGSFKDRELLCRTPYRTLEGALISAHALGAPKIVVGTKRGATRATTRVEQAAAELLAAGWLQGVTIDVVEGPPEYLLGEETALCEVIDGRNPFPRVAPPYRRGIDEVVEHADDVDTGSGLSAHVEMAAPNEESYAPPTAVDNVETLAHVAEVFAQGVDWFRSIGTESSPGSFVATVSGATLRAGVGEFAMGTTLRTVIDELGGGVRAGHEIVAVLQGVSAAPLTADQLDTPLSWEGMEAIGSGLGAAGFIVFDDTTDPIAIAAGVSRFLGVESCGQCTPCKQDGMAISDALARICARDAQPRDLQTVRDRLTTVADSARCSLATQHQLVVGALVDRWHDDLEARGHNEPRAVPVAPIVPFLDVSDDGVATLDLEQAKKQPDWTFSERWNGQAPADRLDEHRTWQPPL